MASTCRTWLVRAPPPRRSVASDRQLRWPGRQSPPAMSSRSAGSPTAPSRIGPCTSGVTVSAVRYLALLTLVASCADDGSATSPPDDEQPSGDLPLGDLSPDD